MGTYHQRPTPRVSCCCCCSKKNKYLGLRLPLSSVTRICPRSVRLRVGAHVTRCGAFQNSEITHAHFLLFFVLVVINQDGLCMAREQEESVNITSGLVL